MKHVLFKFVFGCCVLFFCNSETFSKEFYVAKDISKNILLNTVELNDAVFTQNAVDGIQFLPIAKKELDNNAVQVNLYIKTMGENSYQLIKKIRETNKNTDFNQQLNSIIQIRDKLLESSGYVNFCLAGAISSSINILFMDKIMSGEVVDDSTLKYQLSLEKIVRQFERCDMTEGRTPLFVYDQIIESGNNTFLPKSIFEQNNIKTHDIITFQDWAKLSPDQKFHSGFGKEMLTNINFPVMLYNWLFLLDQGYAIQILFSALNENRLFFNQDSKDIKEKLDQIVTEDKKLMLRTQEKWSGRRVYDFYRKYKHYGARITEKSQFDKLLERALLNF